MTQPANRCFTLEGHTVEERKMEDESYGVFADGRRYDMTYEKAVAAMKYSVAEYNAECGLVHEAISG